MLADVIKYLACPICGKNIMLTDRSLRCTSRHSFDMARQGYVNLLPGGAHVGTADTLEMVEARNAFLLSGHYSPILQEVARAAADLLAEGPDCCIVDIGAGTGYYLAGVLDRLPRCVGLALDISKFAVRRAAKAHERLGAAVCDVWDMLPVQSNSAALVLDIFAPRNAAEFERILKPGGMLIVVTPSRCHLQELIPLLDLLSVDKDKMERLDKQLAASFVQVDTMNLEQPMLLTHADAINLVAMGPSAWHIDKANLDARVSALAEPIRVTMSVTVSVYRLL